VFDEPLKNSHSFFENPPYSNSEGWISPPEKNPSATTDYRLYNNKYENVPAQESHHNSQHC